MQVVILAAGMGTRLGRKLPKPLTPLSDGRTIQRRQLDAVTSAFGEDADVTVVVGYRELMSGAAVDHTEALHFQRRRGIEIAHSDAETLGVATGDRLQVTHDGRTVTGPALVQRGLRPGVVRMAARVPDVGPGSVAAAPAEADDA